jgi:hypothetical protein
MMEQQRKQNLDTIDIDFDWRGALFSIAFFVLFYFSGPLVLVAPALQLWAASSVWRAQDRWDSLKAFAWALPFLYVPCYVFWGQLAALWVHFHLPGIWALWPPTFDALIARWVLALPLAPACAFVLERTHPSTFPARYLLRKPRPGEVLVRPLPKIEDQTQVATNEQNAEPPASTRAAVVQPVLPEAAADKQTTAKPAQPPRQPPAHTHQERDRQPAGGVLSEEATRRTAPTAPDTPLAPSEAAPLAKSRRKINWRRVKE